MEKNIDSLSLKQKKFETLFNFSSNLLLELNESYKILEINNSALDKINSKKIAIINSNFFDYLDCLRIIYEKPTLIKKIKNLNEELQNKQGSTFKISSILLKNGNILIEIKDLTVIARVEKFLESKNSILEFQIEKKTEELTLVKNKVLNFLNAIKIPIIELTTDFKVFFINTYARNLFNINSDLEYNKFINHTIVGDLELLKIRYNEIGNEKITFDSHYSANNQEFNLLWTLTTINTNKKNQILLVGDDITHIKELIKKQDELVYNFKNQTNDMKCLFEISELSNTIPSINEIISEVVSYINNTWAQNIDLKVKINLFNYIYPPNIPIEYKCFFSTNIKINKINEGQMDILSTSTKKLNNNQKNLFKSIILILENAIENKIFENNIIEKQNKLIELQKIGKLGTWEYNFNTTSLIFSEETKCILNINSTEKEINSSSSYTLDSIKDHLSSEDVAKFSSLIKRMESKEHEENITIKYTLPSKKEINLFIQVKSITSINNHHKLIGTIYEITDFITIQKELEIAKVEAENSNKAKSLFLANMSHEIRTPLNAILGFAQILLKNSNISKIAKDQINIINRSGEHLLTLINDILDISKIESGKVELDSNSFNIKLILSDIKNMFYHKANEKNIEFSINFPIGLPDYLIGDSKKLKQIIVNLLGNAFKFTDEGSIHLALAYKQLSNNKYNIIFKVEDTGIGISKDEIDHIFDKFYQTSNSRAGTGLGLSITKNLINIMGGNLKVESKLYRGTIFTFFIDFEIDSTKTKNHIDKEINIPFINNLNKKVLIVDDMLENITLLSTILTNIGIDVYTGINASEALYLFDRINFDLIFMDIILPDLDGKEVIKKIRMHNEKQQPIIIGISASTFEVDIESVLESGANDFIPKPIKLNNFYELIKKYLNINTIEVEKKIKINNTEKFDYNFTSEFKQKFLIALEQGDFFKMTKLIDKIESKETKLNLKFLLNNFKYNKLEEIFNKN